MIQIVMEFQDGNSSTPRRSVLSRLQRTVNQCDWVVGRIMDTVQQRGREEDTLIIFTSDNGCSPSANFKNLLSYGHLPSFQFRGAKADIFEGDIGRKQKRE